VTTWRVTLSCAVLALGAASCSGDDGAEAATTTTSTTATAPTTTTAPTSTTAPERPASTTTTAFDPATVEGEVEAAYLRSWDVYAEAVYNLEFDEAAFTEVFAEEHLLTARNELGRRISEGRAALVRAERDYDVRVMDPSTAVVIDTYVNHQVLIDPVTKVPIESDPNDTVVDVVTLKLIDGRWHVTRIEELQ
jgi:hypothetical protein